jgi:hypothetical protein
MRFYQQQHPFYCGVDLHAKTMHVCIVDQEGQIKVHKNLPTRRDYFLNLIGPYRTGLVVGVECMFAWFEPRGPLRPGENPLCARSRAVHESHSRRQDEERRNRQPQDRAPPPGRHAPLGLCLSASDAGHARPLAPPHAALPHAGRGHRPRAKYGHAALPLWARSSRSPSIAKESRRSLRKRASNRWSRATWL